MEYVIWALSERGRLRVGCSDARNSPIPFCAEIITRVDACDLDMMMLSCRSYAACGWSIEKMRRACEAP